MAEHATRIYLRWILYIYEFDEGIKWSVNRLVLRDDS